MQIMKRLGQAAFVLLGALSAASALAEGTTANSAITNNVTLSFTVNGNAQSDSASVEFRVDRKLVLDVTAADSDWVTVVPGQTTAGNSGVPALNFTVTNRSNDATNVIFALVDQGNTQVTGFGAAGGAFATPPPNVIVAIDNGGGAANGAYDDGADTVLPFNGNYFTLPVADPDLAADEVLNIVVAIDVDGGEANDVYQSYTLVAAVADGADNPLAQDDSGNVAPGSGAASNDALNGLLTLETVWGDAGSANVEDVQFDFFGFVALAGQDADADGQSADASGFVTGVALSLAKFVEVIYDPISGNRYDADRTTVLAEPKAIPGSVLMYVIGIVNENAALTANAVTINDDVPAAVVVGDQVNPAAPIVIPSSVQFAVGSATPTFDLTAVADLDVVSHVACSAPTSAPAYDVNDDVVGDVGDCGAADTAYVAYFVTLDP